MIIDTFNSGLILTQVKSIRLNSAGKQIITTTNKNYGEFNPVDDYWVYQDSKTEQVHILTEKNK